jgi:hypothetical protein
MPAKNSDRNELHLKVRTGDRVSGRQGAAAARAARMLRGWFRARFRDELLNNLEVLKEIRDDRNELASPRIMSIREINDRALGRPVQPNESANEFVPSANPVEEVERLEREVEQLSAQRLRRELPSANASE